MAPNDMNESRTETEPMQQMMHLLGQRGLSDWWAILSQWLPNFDGWLAAMEASDDPEAACDDSPAGEIIDLLQRAENAGLVDDLEFAAGISKLDFLRRRARLTKSGKRWSSFEEPFERFAAIEPDEPPHVFEYEPNSEAVTKYWLLGKLFELQHVRLQSNQLVANGKHAVSRP